MDENSPARLASESVAGRPMTKRELKQLRRLEKLGQEKQEGSRNTIRWIILGVGVLLFVAFFGSLIFLTKQNSQKPIAFSDVGWVRGSQSAKVTLTEFADFQCPACKAYHPLVLEVFKNYQDKGLRLVFNHFPSTSHKNAFPAAMAAEAAGAQGKFFEMHDILYERQDEWAQLPTVAAQEKFISYAVELRLDQEKFLRDLSEKALEEKIRANQDEGINNGVSGIPTFFINGKKIENPSTLAQFSKLIGQALK